MLEGALRERIRTMIRKVCKELGVQFVSGVLPREHVPMLAEIPPHIAIGDFVRRVKGRLGASRPFANARAIDPSKGEKTSLTMPVRAALASFAACGHVSRHGSSLGSCTRSGAARRQQPGPAQRALARNIPADRRYLPRAW